MSYLFLNGYGTPDVVIQDVATLENVKTISLDLCMIEGLAENYQEIFQRIELDYQRTIIDYDFRGCRINFTLDYNSYCSASNLLNIDLIHYYNSLPELYKLWLHPRTTASNGRAFEVRLSGESWKQQLIYNRSDTVGHKGVIISFQTVRAESKNFSDTNNNVVITDYYAI